MPPEGARHERCWIAWPCREELWGERMAAARQAYAEVAQAIAQFEPVTMIARPELTAEASLHCGQGISVLPLDYDNSWTRDTLPTFVADPQGQLAGIDWQFNGCGQSAPNYAKDARLAEAICERLKVPRFVAPIVLEGGAMHVDGEGTCLVCAGSVLDPKRNPGVGRAEIEAALADHLGIAKVIWLEQGLVGDRNGGHVDNLACFARPGVVLALACRDPEDANHAVLQDNLARLRAETDAKGRALEIVEIEQPGAQLAPTAAGFPPPTSVSTWPTTPSSCRCSTRRWTTPPTRRSPRPFRTAAWSRSTPSIWSMAAAASTPSPSSSRRYHLRPSTEGVATTTSRQRVWS